MTSTDIIRFLIADRYHDLWREERIIASIESIVERRQRTKIGRLRQNIVTSAMMDGQSLKVSIKNRPHV